MLILSRQRDEQIVIGDDIVVTVVDIRGDKVRLGVTAPKDVPVHRLEVAEAIKKNLTREQRKGLQKGVPPEQLDQYLSELNQNNDE